MSAKCVSCGHAPHIGVCARRDGGTANSCNCMRTTSPDDERYAERLNQAMATQAPEDVKAVRADGAPTKTSESDGFGGTIDSICRGCGDWLSNHSGPPCPPVLPGFSTQRPPPWGLARAWASLCETAEKMREHSESWRLNAIAMEGAVNEMSEERAQAKRLAEEERTLRLEANARAEILLQALLEVGFEREEGEHMSCRGCGMDMPHVYDADKHGTIYEGDKPGRPCIVGKAMATAGFRALSSAVATRAKGKQP